jgi:EAL domain-containing protein (putative c-di-GMP-specific phosphodiesterase class I)
VEKNGEFGWLGPSSYMPHLESSKVIGPLTRHVLATAASDLAALGPAKSLYVAVKVSPAYMASNHFVSDVRDAAGEMLSRLVLEVTEEGCARLTARALQAQEVLRRGGVRFALSGTGFGRLNFGLLRKFNFNLIKTDRQLLTLGNEERVSRLAAIAPERRSRRFGAGRST